MRESKALEEKMYFSLVKVKLNCSAPMSSSSIPWSKGCTLTMNRYGLSSQALATALISCKQTFVSKKIIVIIASSVYPNWQYIITNSWGTQKLYGRGKEFQLLHRKLPLIKTIIYIKAVATCLTGLSGQNRLWLDGSLWRDNTNTFRKPVTIELLISIFNMINPFMISNSPLGWWGADMGWSLDNTPRWADKKQGWSNLKHSDVR